MEVASMQRLNTDLVDIWVEKLSSEFAILLPPVIDREIRAVFAVDIVGDWKDKWMIVVQCEDSDVVRF